MLVHVNFAEQNIIFAIENVYKNQNQSEQDFKPQTFENSDVLVTAVVKLIKFLVIFVIDMYM